MEIGMLIFLGLIGLGLLLVEETKIGAKLFDKICKALDMDLEPNWED